jgi:hypothetical protein
MKRNSKNITRRSFIERTGAVAAGLTILPGSVLIDQKEGGKTPILTVLERTTDSLLKADRPWEDRSISLNQVLRIGDKWHLWYAAFDHNAKTDDDCYFCYARSKDGVYWEKPSLGVYSFNGNTDNNILLFGINLASFMYDENAPGEQRFKGVGASQRGVKHGPWWVYGATSPDGIRWKVLDIPLLKKNSDSWNTCFRDGNIYRLYVRMWSDGDFKGYRIVGYTESTTFGSFPDPVVILSPDKEDPSDMHFYNSPTTKLKDNLYIMFPSGYFSRDGSVLVYSAFSRDGKNFYRLGHKPFLTLGKGFDSKGIYVSAGAIPGNEPNTYWVYYGGTSLSHDANPDNIHSSGGIGRFLLKVSY